MFFWYCCLCNHICPYLLFLISTRIVTLKRYEEVFILLNAFSAQLWISQKYNWFSKKLTLKGSYMLFRKTLLNLYSVLRSFVQKWAQNCYRVPYWTLWTSITVKILKKILMLQSVRKMKKCQGLFFPEITLCTWSAWLLSVSEKRNVVAVNPQILVQIVHDPSLPKLGS